MATPESDSILTVKEVASLFRLAESTVYKLAQEGKLPGRKIGGTWRFSRRQLMGWFHGEVGTAPPDDPPGFF